mgnify:CR=1 FL=1
MLARDPKRLDPFFFPEAIGCSSPGFGFFSCFFVNNEEKEKFGQRSKPPVAQIFYWDEWQIKREEQIRLKALNRFPWSQLKKIKEDFVDPFTHYWPESSKIMLLELVYRMVFEAYAAGMIERKKAGRQKVTFSQPFDAASRTSHCNQPEEKTISLSESLCLIVTQNDPVDVFITNREKICSQLTDQLVKEFSIFRWMDEWNVQSVMILLEELSRIWFQKGWSE